MSTPVPITATVIPPPLMQPRWAAESMPIASPLTTITPARASSVASCSPTASPYGDGRREPTIATRGPSGGGHWPRERRVASGCDIVQAKAERLEDVVFFDVPRAVEVGRGPRDPPGAVKAARGQATLLSPARNRLTGRRCKAGQLTEAPGFELGVQASLAFHLPAPCSQHPLAHDGRRFAMRLRRERLELHAANTDLQVDAVQQRSGKAPLVGVDRGRRAVARANRVSQPAAWAWIGRGHEREASGVGDRAARTRDDDAAGFQRLAQCLEDRGLKLRQLIQKEDAVVSPRDLARPSHPGPSADESPRRGAAVRRPKWARGVERPRAVELAEEAAHLRHLERLVQLQRREDARPATPQPGLAPARPTPEQEGVTAPG